MCSFCPRLWQEYIVYNVFQDVRLVELGRTRTAHYLVESPLTSVELVYRVSAVNSDGVEGTASSTVQITGGSSVCTCVCECVCECVCVCVCVCSGGSRILERVVLNQGAC